MELQSARDLALQNSYPTFHKAVSGLETLKDDLFRLGAVLVDSELEDIVSVVLLHRHFDLYQGEIMYRAYGSNFYVQTPVVDVDASNCPISWSILDGQLRVIEYSNRDEFRLTPLQQENLRTAARSLSDLGLDQYFGLVLAEATEIGGRETFERNNDNARILLTSHLHEPLANGAEYKTSVIKFSTEDGTLRMKSSGRCAACPSCSISIPALSDTPEALHLSDLFGLGVEQIVPSSRTREFAHDLVKLIENRF